MRGGRSLASLAVLALGGAGALAATGCGTQVATSGPAPRKPRPHGLAAGPYGGLRSFSDSLIRCGRAGRPGRPPPPDEPCGNAGQRSGGGRGPCVGRPPVLHAQSCSPLSAMGALALGRSTRRAEPRLTLACGVHKRGHPPGGAGSERRLHANSQASGVLRARMKAQARGAKSCGRPRTPGRPLVGRRPVVSCRGDRGRPERMLIRPGDHTGSARPAPCRTTGSPARVPRAVGARAAAFVWPRAIRSSPLSR